jgi:hypothetical protein
MYMSTKVHFEFDEDTTKLNAMMKYYADELIDIIISHKDNLETWHVRRELPNDFEKAEIAGFIDKLGSTDSNIEHGLSIQATKTSDLGLLRVDVITTTKREDGAEVFNSILMIFTTDHKEANTVGAKGGNVSYEDLRSLMHSENSFISDFSISSNTGSDPKTHKNYGKRIDNQDGDYRDRLEPKSELNKSPVRIPMPVSDIKEQLKIVLSRLK